MRYRMKSCLRCDEAFYVEFNFPYKCPSCGLYSLETMEIFDAIDEIQERNEKTLDLVDTFNLIKSIIVVES